MLISNLIYELSEIQAEHGNIEVWQAADEEGNSYGPSADPAVYYMLFDEDLKPIVVIWPGWADDVSIYDSEKDYYDIYGDEEW